MPRRAVVFGDLKARALIIPAAGSCGTPSRHQLLSMRSSLLSAIKSKHPQPKVLNQNFVKDGKFTELTNMSHADGFHFRFRRHHVHSDGHRSSLEVLLIVRTKTRSMRNADALIEALQFVSSGSRWVGDNQIYTIDTRTINHGEDSPTVRHENQSIQNQNRSSANSNVRSFRSELKWAPHDSSDNYPPFSLRLLNDSSIPKTQVIVNFMMRTLSSISLSHCNLLS